MSWIALAIISTALFAAAGIFDKLIVSNHVKDSKTYIVCQIIIQQLFIFPIMLICGVGFVFPDSILAILIGMVQIVPAIYYLRAMQVEELSRVASLEYLYPVLVFLGGYAVLGEKLTAGHYAGGALLVIGVFLCSFRPGRSGSLISPAIKPFLYYWIFTALYCISIKYLLASITEFDLFVWSSIGNLLGVAPLLMISQIRSETVGFFSSGRRTVGALVAEETLHFAGLMLSIFAYSAGSVALVTAVGALQPFITLIAILVMSVLMPGALKEQINRRTLAQKLASTFLVAIGIYCIC